jgi:protein O-mannosyl-transferase
VKGRHVRPFLFPEVQMFSRQTVLLPFLITLLLAAVIWWAYAPGLHGGFLFDDFANLPSLGATGPIDSWPAFCRYITSGIADPTGRPLTLLSFLLDARNWPADPYPFKRTNLILHLINGALLYLLLTKLGRALAIDAYRCQTAALLGTALWLLHPLLVSTTLYIVQREAMLPATCVLVGLLIWLHGRNQLMVGKVGTGSLWSAAGLGGFTLLAVLAKANGALLPIYALLIEIIVLSPRRPFSKSIPQRNVQCALLFVFVVLPTIGICTYLVWVGVHGILTGGPALRPWSYAQRLLTEPRVLTEYLSLLWLPRPYSSGLFNDQYVASTSLLHPLTTLPAIFALLALIGGAWWLRRRQPVLALAILFYFAGQLLESTSLPLELYFEHRNYVPALLMFWPLGLWLADMRTLTSLKRGLMLALPLGLALMTHARAQEWGNVQTQASLWAQINPNSARAQTNAAQIEIQTGRSRDAIRRLQALLATQPDQVQLAFNLIGARCMAGGVRPEDISAARKAMQSTINPGSLLTSWFERTLPVVASGGCPGMTPADLLDLIDAGLRNPKLAAAGPQQDLTYLRGRVILTQRRPDAALTDFIRALDLQIRPGMALESAATLGAAGYPSQGLRVLDHYEQVQQNSMPPAIGMPQLHDWVLARQDYWPHELAHLRQQLSLDARVQSINTSPPTPDQKPTR